MDFACWAKELSRSKRLALWVQLHAKAERQLAVALRRVFLTVGQQALKQLLPAVQAEQFQAGEALSYLAFAGTNLDQLIRDTAGPLLLSSGIAAAMQELALFLPKRYARAYAGTNLAIAQRKPGGAGLPSLGPEHLTKLPDDVRKALELYRDQLLMQGYWTDVAGGMRQDVADLLLRGVLDGESGKDVAKKLADLLGPLGSMKRGLLIGRSESTGMLNAGADASRQNLAARGLVKTKEWLSILDGDTRPAHVKANGQTAPVSGLFVVGGEPCRYPGDFRLSPAQRCNCRCAATSIPISDEELQQLEAQEAQALGLLAPGE